MSKSRFDQILDRQEARQPIHRNGDGPTTRGDHSPKVSKLADLSKFVNGKLSAQRVGRSTKLAVSKAITDHLLSKKQLVFDTVTATPAVLDEEHRLFAIGDDKQALAARAYLRESGINATETAYKFLLEEMRIVALKNQSRIEQKPVYRSNTLYIPCGTSFVVRATVEKGLEKLPNGTDGVYFWSDVSIPEWTPVAKTEAIDPMTLEAFQISYDAPAQSKDYTAEMQKKLVCIWIMALLAGVEPLPILATLGGAGGGKSTLIRAIARLLLGRDADLTTLSSDKRDFDAATSKRILVGYDNLDRIPDKGEWLFDALAAVATGATNQRRTFFTNADLTDLTYIAGCMISSRTAVFARQDVAERTLPIFTRRFEDSKRTEEAVLYADLADKRDGVLSYLAYGAIRLMYTKEQAPKGLAARFQTFAKLTWAYCNAYRKPEHAESILDALFEAQSLSVGDADPLMRAIVEHLPQEGLENLTASEVVARVQILSTDIQIPNLGGGKRIAASLRELKPMLAMLGIELTEREKMERPFFTLKRQQTPK